MFSLPKNCLAYAERLSTYLLCPSANNVSYTKDDFPDPDKFVGFDISVSMLANALVKHPEYTYVVQDCSQPIDIKCDVLTSVFGTPNYIGAAKLLEHYEAMNAKHAFFVFYAPWYEDGVATDYYRPTVEELTEMFGKFNPKIKQIRDNYILVRW